MALIVKKPKGTEDIVPSKVYKWHTVEKIVSEAAEIYGFKEIRVPTFEETGLFVRSVGETTDVFSFRSRRLKVHTPSGGNIRHNESCP